MQQDAMDRKIVILSHLAQRIAAWLQAIVLIFSGG